MKTEKVVNLVTYFTDAPEAYDGFGTRTLDIVGMRRGNFFREVAIPAEHVDWQTSRYASGLYVAMTEGEVIGKRIDHTGFDREVCRLADITIAETVDEGEGIRAIAQEQYLRLVAAKFIDAVREDEDLYAMCAEVAGDAFYALRDAVRE